MSDTAPDTLMIREAIVRIDRMIDEAAKFRAEAGKLQAEADKFRRDRFLAPVLAAGALGGAIAAILAILSRAWGGL